MVLKRGSTGTVVYTDRPTDRQTEANKDTHAAARLHARLSQDDLQRRKDDTSVSRGSAPHLRDLGPPAPCPTSNEAAPRAPTVPSALAFSSRRLSGVRHVCNQLNTPFCNASLGRLTCFDSSCLTVCKYTCAPLHHKVTMPHQKSHASPQQCAAVLTALERVARRSSRARGQRRRPAGSGG